MNGSRASRTASTAITVFAICISARMFSCMRAPPEAATDTNGTPWATARSAAIANFSPTTLPIEPPRKLKSITASTAERPPIMAVPTTLASPRPVASSAAARRSMYGFRSMNASGSAERRSAPTSTNVPGSVSCEMRSRAVTAKW